MSVWGEREREGVSGESEVSKRERERVRDE